jgi:frataxin-like iron-binding protein CyaY
MWELMQERTIINKQLPWSQLWRRSALLIGGSLFALFIATNI